MILQTFGVSVFFKNDDTWTDDKKDAFKFKIQEAIRQAFTQRDMIRGDISIAVICTNLEIFNLVYFEASMVCESKCKIPNDNWFDDDVFKTNMPNVTFEIKRCYLLTIEK